MAAAPKELTTAKPGAGRRSVKHVSKHSESGRMSAAFERYIGIDYSGAETCESGLKGLRVYMGDRATEPRKVAPPPVLARIGRARRLLIGSLKASPSHLRRW